MSPRLMHGMLLAIPLLFVAGARAAAAADASPIPKESTDRVLDNIRDFAGGKPSPNILYPTRTVGEVTNGPGAAPKGSAAVITIDSRPGSGSTSRPLAPSRLTGGTLERRVITPAPATPNTITPQPITPYTITSPWQ